MKRSFKRALGIGDIEFSNKDGLVVLDFWAPIHSFAMTPENAADMAGKLYSLAIQEARNAGKPIPPIDLSYRDLMMRGSK